MSISVRRSFSDRYILPKKVRNRKFLKFLNLLLKYAAFSTALLNSLPIETCCFSEILKRTVTWEITLISRANWAPEETSSLSSQDGICLNKLTVSQIIWGVSCRIMILCRHSHLPTLLSRNFNGGIVNMIYFDQSWSWHSHTGEFNYYGNWNIFAKSPSYIQYVLQRTAKIFSGVPGGVCMKNLILVWAEFSIHYLSVMSVRLLIKDRPDCRKSNVLSIFITLSLINRVMITVFASLATCRHNRRIFCDPWKSLWSAFWTALFGPCPNAPKVELTNISALGVTKISIVVKPVSKTRFSTAVTIVSTSFLTLSAMFLSVTRTKLWLFWTNVTRS